jgi:hypothetical protein
MPADPEPAGGPERPGSGQRPGVPGTAGDREPPAWRQLLAGWDPLRIIVAIAVRPDLWRTALHQLVVLAPPGWWRRRPPLPVPEPDYLRFRLHTAYGEDGTQPPPADVVAFLEWCRRARALHH